MELRGGNICAGGYRESSGSRFKALAPASGQLLEPDFEEADAGLINQALVQAEEAFASYRKLKAEARAQFLDRIAVEIEDLGEGLIERAQLETALPKERLAGERGRTINQLKMFAQLIREGSWVEARIDRAIPDRQPLPKPDIRRMLIPMGPVAVFGASNFPLAFSVAGGDTASALAAGCPVVVKAHPAHPGTSEMVAAAVIKAACETGMPAGVFSMLHGIGHEVGIGIVRHPLTRAVGFTGSLRGGRALFDAAAGRPIPIPVYAEMGSINPFFILPGALKERAESIAEGLKNSVTLGSGQFCTCPGLAVGVAGDNFDRFKKVLGEMISEAPAATMLYPGILQAYNEGITRLSAIDGLDIIKSNQPADSSRTQCSPAMLSTSAEIFIQHTGLSEEVFGPSTVLVSCKSIEDMERIARGLQGHLTATIHGTEEDLKQQHSLISILEDKVGRLVFNGYPTGVEVCPSMHHGGPYPATTDSRSTSVGTAAIQRFARPVCYQGFPDSSLPDELKNLNPRGIWRLVDNRLTKEG